MEQEIAIIKQNLKASQDIQKCNADKNKVNEDFGVGDHVFLIDKPRDVYLNLGIHANLTLRYCVPFEVLDVIGLVAYRHALFSYIRNHDFFHTSLLKKYAHDLNHVIDWIMN
jgi:hypothetical protein